MMAMLVSIALFLNGFADVGLGALCFVGHEAAKMVASKTTVELLASSAAPLSDVYFRLFGTMCVALGLTRIQASISSDKWAFRIGYLSYVAEVFWIVAEIGAGTYDMSFETEACAGPATLAPKRGCDAQIAAGILGTCGTMLLLLTISACVCGGGPSPKLKTG
mmetsp:Transcript_8962/g.14248  ORF Transcript_8962/g.14248 Transcript_8962/m.14248 type:complete len:163 (-) Transcript_8962:272-760(-)